MTGASSAAESLVLEPETLRDLRQALPALSAAAVEAIVNTIPSYQTTLTGSKGQTIRSAVELALVNFLRLAQRSSDVDPSVPIELSTQAAYDLGRGEARSGRTMEALLAAYRIGARVSWQRLSQVAADAGVSAATMGRFAELVFAYIDELNAASVAGHSDELATTGRVKIRYLEQLGKGLLTGEPPEKVIERAERAKWDLPDGVVVLLCAEEQVPWVLPLLPANSLAVADDSLDLPDAVTAIIAPCGSPPARRRIVTGLSDRKVTVGPMRPWRDTTESLQRSLRAHRLGHGGDAERRNQPLVDTEALLPELLAAADPGCHADVRARVFAPLADLTDTQRDKLVETLRAYLLCQGRRDDMADMLFVHPQTVRYRMNQLRDAYGDTLTDPAHLPLLVIAATIQPGQ